jgi:hypothetical protein
VNRNENSSFDRTAAAASVAFHHVIYSMKRNFTSISTHFSSSFTIIFMVFVFPYIYIYATAAAARKINENFSIFSLLHFQDA